MPIHKGKILDTVRGYEIIECDHCGFIHVNPIPSEENLERIYRKEYYTIEKPQFIDRQVEDLEWWHVVYDERYDFFEEHLRTERRRILDIGCGPGFFLQRGVQRGWKGIGIEPSTQASGYAKGLGLEVLNCFPDNAGFEKKDDKFDVIHLSEVLEHIPDPLSLCKRAYTLLDKGGILCVVVPNDYNPLQSLIRKQLGFPPYWIGPPHHINYFTFESLERLLKRIGFNILYTTATYPMELFLLMGDNYVGNDKLGRECHAKRKRLDIALNDPALRKFKKDMYRLMAKYSIGREVVLYGVK